ncbi:MAG: OmpH family outer membrane protein [Steroidobacteraceae bacterium]|nr:OmpH family outer membrane protein [Deltaproteobacteria bacterium]
MPSQFKKLLIAMIITLPTLANAADGTPADATKSTAPAAAAVNAQQTPAAAAKPSEATAVRQSLKLGQVDIVRIGGESDRGKALKALLTSRKNALQTKIDGRKKQIEKFKTSIESKLPGMTPPQREAKSKEFQKKMEDFQKFARSSEEELYTLQEKETKALFEVMEQSAAAYGKANDFAAIVVKKELLYVGNTVDTRDVTDELIKSMNAAGHKK